MIAKEAFSDKYGARNVRRYIQTHIEDAIAEKMIISYEEGLSSVALSINEAGIEVVCK